MTTKAFVRTLGALALFVLIAQSTITKADEVTGTLSTGLTATVGTSLTGTVTSPVTTTVTSSGGGFSGGGGGGGGGLVTSSAKTATVVTTATTTPITTGTEEVLGASTYNFTTPLTIGSTGSDVVALQNLLITDGYLTLAMPTGYFGSITKAAVMKFQAAHSISTTGYVGDLTLAALNAGVLPAVPENSALIASLKAQLVTLEAELAAIVASSTTPK